MRVVSLSEREWPSGRGGPACLDVHPKETSRLSFARTYARVLDCANGYQKENQEEVYETEEGRLFEEEASKEGRAKTAVCKEIREEGDCSE